MGSTGIVWTGLRRHPRPGSVWPALRTDKVRPNLRQPTAERSISAGNHSASKARQNRDGNGTRSGRNRVIIEPSLGLPLRPAGRKSSLPHVRQHQPTPPVKHRARVQCGGLRNLALGGHMPRMLQLPDPPKRLRQVPGPRRSRIPPSARHHLCNRAAPAALRQVRQPGRPRAAGQPSPGLAAARHPDLGAWGRPLNERRRPARPRDAGPDHAMPAGGGSDD